MPLLGSCSGSDSGTTTTEPGNDTVTQAVGAGGGTVVTPSGAAGVQIPAGTFSQQVMVTITRLPTPSSPGAGPLPTSLKQYGPYYDFTTSPQVAQFGDSARVGVCQVTDPSSAFYAPEPHDRLRLAHTVGSSIEILDRVGVSDFLRCTNVSASRSTRTGDNGWRAALLAIRDNAIGLLRPAKLYAAHGGLGGKVRSFSPFGAVDPAVATVTVTLASPTVTVGSSVQATVVLKDADGNSLTGRVVTWTSSDVTVATVSSSGLVTGVAAGGPVTITAASEGQSGTGAVTVTAVPVASVTITPPSLSLVVGATGQLAATTRDASNSVLTGRPVSWSSSSDAIATVTSSGLVTAVSPGTATITAGSEGKTATATVTAEGALAGTWTGTYSWTCAGGGSTPIVFTFSATSNPATYNVVASYRGSATTGLLGRYSSVVVSQFGSFNEGVASGNGQFIRIDTNGSTTIPNNIFSGSLSGTSTIAGTTLNGDSSAGGTSLGCSENTGPAGSFSITKTP